MITTTWPTKSLINFKLNRSVSEYLWSVDISPHRVSWYQWGVCLTYDCIHLSQLVFRYSSVSETFCILSAGLYSVKNNTLSQAIGYRSITSIVCTDVQAHSSKFNGLYTNPDRYYWYWFSGPLYFWAILLESGTAWVRGMTGKYMIYVYTTAFLWWKRTIL